MNARIYWLYGLVCFMSSALTLRAVNPDLILAPTPRLSQDAWKELQQTAGIAKSVKLSVQITAAHGSIKEVVVKDVQHWPRTASEVQSWIRQQWKFVPAFSGTVVQPISFRVLKAGALPTPLPAKNGSWTSVEWSFFVKAPKPPFPRRYDSEVKAYQIQHGYLPGVLLVMTVREGVILEIRVLDQKGPVELCDYMVEWVRQHWQFRPNVTGSYRVPVYFQLR